MLTFLDSPIDWLFLRFRKIPDNQVLRNTDKLEEIIVSTSVKEVIFLKCGCIILATVVIAQPNAEVNLQ